MSILYTGGEGTTLRDIIAQYDNIDFDYIEYRCKWTDEDGNKNDDFIGVCSYRDGELIAGDGDIYSLDDQFIHWERWVDYDEEFADGGAMCLTVWEKGVVGPWEN